MWRMAQYRDSSGRTLADYPRPSVAVDTALLTVVPDTGLSVLLVRRMEGKRALWALPGTFLHEGERLTDAVTRCPASMPKATNAASTPPLTPAKQLIMTAANSDCVIVGR